MLDNKSSFLVTGVSGFIGSALVKRLLKNGNKIVGVDNMNNYYDVSLKHSRLEELFKSSKIYRPHEVKPV